MTNDAKLALVIGVGLVVAVAIFFSHKEIASRPADDKTPANVGNPPAAPPSDTRNPQRRPVWAPPAGSSMTLPPDGDSLSHSSAAPAVGSVPK